MGGRRDDSAPGAHPPLPPLPARPGLAPAPPAPAVRRPAPVAVAEEPSGTGRAWLVVGLVLAAGATAATFLTEDPRYLRVALLAVCWAFVVAAFLAGNRRADRVAAAGREAELRHVYDLELEREVTARHEFEVELESRLRREAEDAMRAELAQLRAELARLSALREELAGLGQLRAEVAALTELRGDLAVLGQLRTELAGLGELRDDLGRMRTELTEQLSGELLIERLVMRAQSVRGPAQSPVDAGRTLDGGPAWESPAPAVGWEVDRWSESRVLPVEPAQPAPRPVAGPPPVPRPVLRTERPAAGYDSSAYDDILFGGSTPAPAPSYEPRSYAPPAYAPPAYDPPAYEPVAYEPVAYEPSSSRSPQGPPEPQGHARLEQILAESGVEAPTGGRSRRRRYRDEDGDPTDDVLARVLGRS